MTDYSNILVEQRDAVTLVTLNRPQALNALNSEVLKELIAAFAAYDADPSQRCLVLTGSGEKAFAAGADIKEMQPQGFADEMEAEYALASRVVRTHDFREGVRAVLIDKDNAPRWDPPAPEQVTGEMLDILFAPLPPGDQWTPFPETEQ